MYLLQDTTVFIIGILFCCGCLITLTKDTMSISENKEIRTAERKNNLSTIFIKGFPQIDLNINMGINLNDKKNLRLRIKKGNETGLNDDFKNKKNLRAQVKRGNEKSVNDDAKKKEYLDITLKTGSEASVNDDLKGKINLRVLRRRSKETSASDNLKKKGNITQMSLVLKRIYIVKISNKTEVNDDFKVKKNLIVQIRKDDETWMNDDSKSKENLNIRLETSNETSINNDSKDKKNISVQVRRGNEIGVNDDLRNKENITQISLILKLVHKAKTSNETTVKDDFIDQRRRVKRSEAAIMKSHLDFDKMITIFVHAVKNVITGEEMGYQIIEPLDIILQGNLKLYPHFIGT